MVVVIIIGVLLAVQFGRQVYANWEIGQRAVAIEAQIAKAEAENAQLERELAYLQSEAYISAEARRLANLGAPGENVLIIPPGAEEPLPDELVVAAEPPKPLLEQWVSSSAHRARRSGRARTSAARHLVQGRRRPGGGKPPGDALVENV